MKTRSDVVVYHNDVEYVSLSKLIGLEVVDIVGEPDREYESFNIHGVVLKDGRFLRIDSDYSGEAYIMESNVITSDLLLATAIPTEDEYEDEYGDDTDEWEDDADWGDDDDE